MPKILKSEEIYITRKEANFDRACDEAYNSTVSLLGIDDDGHASVKGWIRSSCHVRIQFVRYEYVGSMAGHEHTYVFLGQAVKGD